MDLNLAYLKEKMGEIGLKMNKLGSTDHQKDGFCSTKSGSKCSTETTKKVINDNVNHPKHYEKSCSIECFDVMKIAFGPVAVYDFCVCNAFKYIWRYKNKNGLEDLDKAEWYIHHAGFLYNEIRSDGIINDKSELRHMMDKIQSLENELYPRRRDLINE